MADAGDGDPTVSALTEGVRVGRYIVGKPLGSGAMGHVYAAYDPELDRKVAIKVLSDRSGSPDAVDSQAQGNRRLLREAQAIAKLAHPNIVRVHDVGTIGERDGDRDGDRDGGDEGRVFIAMEHIEGMTLAAWSEAQPRTPREVAAVYRSAALGLAHAHAAGLVHRDFKPRNVLIDHRGRVLVTDFGLARVLEAEASVPTLSRTDEFTPESVANVLATLTDDGALVGTPAYMAPEQLAGRPADARSDQFAFCVSLYESLYGQRPFDGDTMTSLVQSVVRGNIRSTPRGRHVPPRLRRIVLRGLATEPDDRHLDMQTLARRLRPRRFRWPLAVSAAGSVAVVAAAVVANADSERYCDRLEAQLDGVWDASVRDRVVDAFSTSTLGFSDSAAERAIAEIDQYTSMWVEQMEEACRAQGVEEALTTVAARMGCLSARKDAVAALSDLLVIADDTVILGTADAVAGLPSIEECRDAHELSAAPPADMVDAVDELNRELARVHTLSNAGLAAETLAAAEALVQRADALEYEPMQAEATLELAKALVDSGRMTEGENSYHRALSAGLAGEYHRVVAEAAAGLCYVANVNHSPASEVTRWVEVGTAALDRVGREMPLHRVQLAVSLGATQRDNGQLDEAEATFRRALQSTDPKTPGGGSGMAALYAGLGLTLSKSGDQEQAAKYIAQATEALRELYGVRHPNYAAALQNAAIPHLRNGAYTQALSLYTQSHGSLVELLGADHISTATTGYSVAMALLYMGRYDEAREYAEKSAKAYRAAAGPRSRAAADSSAILCEIEMRAGRLAEAEAAAKDAISIIAVLNVPAKLASYRSQLGNVYRLGGHYEQAAAELQAALKLQAQDPGEDSVDYAETLGRVVDLGLDQQESSAELVAQAHTTRSLYRTLEPDPHIRADADLRYARAVWAFDPSAAAAQEAAGSVRDGLAVMEALGEDGERIATHRRWLETVAP